MTYKNCQITYNPNCVGQNYQWSHVDYDGAEDGRCGSGATIQACKDEIDAMEEN